MPDPGEPPGLGKDGPDVHTLSFHGQSVIALVVGMFFLFTRPRVPVQATALVALLALSLLFSVWPYQGPDGPVRPSDFFAMFGNESLIAICSLLIIGRGLVATGALEPVARQLARLWGANSHLAMLAVLVSCILLSGFVNDTPIVVLLIPVLTGLAVRTGGSASPLLMPMNFAVLIGGMATTIGTSSNLLVAGIAADLDAAHFRVFDFAPIVLTAAVIALPYLWLVVPRLLPVREQPLGSGSPRVFDAVLYVTPGSPSNGSSLGDLRRRTGNRLNVERIQRADGVLLARLPEVKLQAGDRLFVRASPADLKEFETVLGLTLYNTDDINHPVSGEHPLRAPDQKLGEVVLTADSPLVGETLRDARFAEKFDLVIVAFYRAGHRQSDDAKEVADRILSVGDVLLVQGAADKLAALRGQTGMLVIDGSVWLPRTRRAPIAMAILGAVIASVALHWLPMYLAALAGVVVLLLTRCIQIDSLGVALKSEVVLIVAASLALGKALVDTGGADFLAQQLLRVVSSLPTPAIIGILMTFVALLTNVVSNAAAAAVATPIAVQIARQLGADPTPFVLAILFGCNLCYATPIGYQTNLLVMSAGQYEFRDFMRAGAPLVVLMIGVLTFLICRQYGL